MKFKVGDEVKIKSDFIKYTDHANKIGTVIESQDWGFLFKRYDNDICAYLSYEEAELTENSKFNNKFEELLG